MVTKMNAIYTEIEAHMTEIFKIWKTLGLNEEQISHRTCKIGKHVRNLFLEILQEEKSRFDSVNDRVHYYEKNIKDLSESLGIKPNTEFSGVLIENMKHLENELKILTEIKHDRMKTLEVFKNKEKKLCQILKFPSHVLPFGAIPTQKDLDELEQHVASLEEEIILRRKRFIMLKLELTTIQEVTEYVVESSVEKAITSYSEISSLSNETFEVLEKAIATAQKLKEELGRQKKELLDKLSILWQDLKISDRERKEFLLLHSDCRASTLSALRQEIERCEKLRRENIKMLVSSFRQELNCLWDKCHIPETQRHLFHYYSAKDVSEEAVKAYDAEIKKWEKYYDDVKYILAKVEKRNALFNLLIAFANKTNDPNRFKNRKGNLLQEERERKKLQRDLPALENEIFEDIAKYEKESCTYFLYDGVDFRSFISNQRTDLKMKKEKTERQKQHLLQQQQKGVTKSTPARPPVSASTKSAPSKLVNACHGLSIRTPSKKIPCTVSKIANICSHLSTPVVRKIDKDRKNTLRNIIQQQSPASSSLNITTYSDFAEELNKPARCSSRKFVVASKKVGGTRISTSRKRRASKFLRAKHSSNRAVLV